MDDLAALQDITGPAVLKELLERFKQGKYDTYFGDCLLCINPCQPATEHESQLGRWYRNRKPLQELPPHVMAVAHRAYRMVVNDVTAQAIVIDGRTGSGKTEAARRVVSQLLREARLSPHEGLGPRVILAQNILTTLMTARSSLNPSSTRGIKMATLYLRPDGTLASGEMGALCADTWHAVDSGGGSGVPCVFTCLLAGLSDTQRQQYYLLDSYRLMSRGASSPPPLFVDREDHARHVDMFDDFMAALSSLRVDETTQNYAGQEMSAILSVLAAILHLSNVDFAEHQPGQTAISNPHEMRAACDLLSLPQEHMEAELLSTTVFINGQPVGRLKTAGQAALERDALLVEMHRRLVRVILLRVNQALAPHPHTATSPLTPVTVVDGLAMEESPDVRMRAGLETLFRNMAAERLKYHVHDVVFRLAVAACERERVKVYAIKFPDNTEVVSAMFGPEHGILSRLAQVSAAPGGSPLALVSLLDADKALKKGGSYVASSKAARDTFAILHSASGQVTYSARDFLYRDAASLPESTRHMLLRSLNPVVPAMAEVGPHAPGLPGDVSPSGIVPASRTFQNDLTYLLQTLDDANIHYIRCVRPNSGLAPGQFSSTAVSEQLKEGAVVETARQRKFGHCCVVPLDTFLRRFRELAFSPLSRTPAVAEACKIILTTTGLLDKGVALTKTSVFLRYWHVTRLHALKAHRLSAAVFLQAHARGFLTRMRLGGRTTSSQQRTLVGQFLQDASRTGDWVTRTGQEHHDWDRRRFERELQNVGSRLQHPGWEREDERREMHPHPHPHSQRGQVSRRESEDVQLPGYISDFEPPSALDPTTTFYKSIVDKVLASINTLDPTTWVKIIYMERGRQVAKVYAEDKSIIIDGSHGEFDGERLGLGAFRNEDRDEETAYFRSSVIEGLRLKRDPDGSLSVCRLCEQGVLVKGGADVDSGGAGGCLSADVLLCQGRLPLEKTVKIFDINEFRSKIALDMKQDRFSKAKMQRACVVGLSFGRDDADDLQTPCWMCIVNVKALLALDSEEIIREAQQQTAKLELTSVEEVEEKELNHEAKTRTSRDRWARTDQRDHLQEKARGERHVRQQLRAKGMEVGQHLDYSWKYTSGGEKTTMEALHEMVAPGLHAGRSRDGGGKTRDWAKVETALKDQRTRSVVDRRSSDLPSPDY